MFKFYIKITIFRLFFFLREYADELVKQGKVFKEVAKEKLDDVAAETMKSKFYTKNLTRFIMILFILRCERICL